MARFTLSLALLAFATSGASAFNAAPVLSTSVRSAVASPTARFGLLTEDETKVIMDKSIECAEGECTVDDVNVLLYDLKDQKEILQARLVEITNMIDSLTKANEAQDRPVDEVRETVRAIARLFLMGDKASGNDYPALSKPTGWTGDVGKGARSAYDVLPPKKWTPPKEP